MLVNAAGDSLENYPARPKVEPERKVVKGPSGIAKEKNEKGAISQLWNVLEIIWNSK